MIARLLRALFPPRHRPRPYAPGIVVALRGARCCEVGVIVIERRARRGKN